jgi:hypothetical protein
MAPGPGRTLSWCVPRGTAPDSPTTCPASSVLVPSTKDNRDGASNVHHHDGHGKEQRSIGRGNPGLHHDQRSSFGQRHEMSWRFGIRDIDKSTPRDRSPELARSGRPPLAFGEHVMTSHRRLGLLARLRSHRSTKPAVPAPRPSIELVDGRTRVAHRVTTDELQAASRAGSCTALCGMRVFAASLADPGRRRCSVCSS